MSGIAPHVFTIPSSVPFLPRLIEALLGGEIVKGFPVAGEPLSLARATLYLPTRRACRQAQDAFLEALNGKAAILPRIAPIGDIDEDDIIFAQAATGTLAADALAIEPAIDGLDRKLILAQLIRAWAERIQPDKGALLVANTPAAALALADELARLLDDMITREVSWDKLDTLVPGELDRYWQITLDFLKVAREVWPQILQANGRIEQAERRDRLIAAELARLETSMSGPVIAAGSTGSMPSTARLLTAIARLPQGAVVLPGLDTDLDQASWNLIPGTKDRSGAQVIAPSAGHPQFALEALLRRMQITRSAVTVLDAPRPHGREMLVSEAMRPAASSERWQERHGDMAFAAQTDRAMAGISVIEAAHSEEEALAIAIALRESLEDADTTASLITPDRALARRVLSALQRWKVPVDDSGGDMLADTGAGIFARLAAQVALQDAAPVPLLALLKHPLLHLGAATGAHAAATSILELAVLRGPRPRPGLAGLAHALATFRETQTKLHHRDPRKQLSEAGLLSAQALVEALTAALAPLEHLAKATHPLAAFARAHRDAMKALSSDVNGQAHALSGRDGSEYAVLDAAFEAVTESEFAASFKIGAADYADAFHATVGSAMVRRPGDPRARIRILGPLEARLQQSDRVILGGLNEGTWPPETRSDPWLSRPMRSALGLDLPERRIGLSAHDLAQALGAKEVILTRAAKVDGAPTVASRFLQRLAAIAGKERSEAAHKRGDRHLALARALDHAHDPKPCARPEPRPPQDARPRQLSVTEIEHWLRDPYTIYAKHILRLRALDPVDTPPGARDRGSAIHEAIGGFTERFATELPPGALQHLLEMGRENFAPLEDYPEARAFWWPRFERIAAWFVQWESERRPAIANIHAEISGEIAIAPAFKLTVRADRIEKLADDRYAILDYKTGQPPTTNQVAAGLAPQLTLEAAILREGGFKDIPAGASVAELTYIHLTGAHPAGKPEERKFKDSTPDAEADKALAKLRELVERFSSVETPYISFSRPQWVGRTYSDYDHLARVKEWSASGGESTDSE